MIVFACLAPHAPIFLPDIGSETDRDQVKKTITALARLGQKMAAVNPDCLLITSPHPDWGFNVPLYFLAKDIHDIEVKTQLTDQQSPQAHFERGQKLIAGFAYIKRLAWIASGDMSHRLKKDGPYGLHPSGEKFDQKFISLLKKKDISGILALDPVLIEEAGECGLRSFCMLLGALEEAQVKWQPEILSYEGPFGVGYLVSQLV